MEEKGEFEQRPEMKPADQVPLPQKKANPTTGILCVVFALVALGLGGYLIYDKVIAKDDKTNCAVADKNDEKKENETNLLGDKDTSFIYSPSVYGVFYGTYFVTNEGDVYLNTDSTYADYDSSVKWTPTMAKEAGEKGNFELKAADIRGGEIDVDGADSYKINGFKLNLTNIRYLTEIMHGQQRVGVQTAFIDKDGNLSLLFAKDEGKYPRETLILKKNIDKNVVSVLPVYDDNGYNTMIFYRDGSSKLMDVSVFEER